MCHANPSPGLWIILNFILHTFANLADGYLHDFPKNWRFSKHNNNY